MTRRPEDSKNWGGPRPGSGRPALSGERRVTVSVNLTPTLRDWLDGLAGEWDVSRSEALAVILADYRKLLDSPKGRALIERLRKE
ncbi:MAG: hypothetical protein FJZ01_20595 [Candidatus Sericytochromatia bacterium]|nr:hypothetical protein [Candidatus Tanganyikabacteria bacterium]